MGIGAIVTGLANLMVGETLLGARTLATVDSRSRLGAVVFRLLVAGAVRAGSIPTRSSW